jgi:hypothetical protein
MRPWSAIARGKYLATLGGSETSFVSKIVLPGAK